MRAIVVGLLLTLAAAGLVAASPYTGQVTFGGLPVPGATVTALRGDTQIVVTTDQQGVYRFPDLADGVWSIRIEMLGFMALTEEITAGPDAMPKTSVMTMLPFEVVAAASDVRPKADAAKADAAKASASKSDTKTPRGSESSEFQRADVATAATANRPGNPAADTVAPAANPDAAADGLLVNGSVNNGAASPFAQLAAFGNNRRGARSLYNWGLGLIFGSSAFDARPFSFTSQPAPKPSYNDVQLLGTFGGPIKIPGIIQNWPNVFVGYQRTSDHTATTQSTLVPTELERRGDFSQSRDRFGRPITIVNPATGFPFSGGVIPGGAISSQAAALLAYYPLPNAVAPGSNYQAPVSLATHQDSVQSRINQPLSGRTQLFGSFGFQRTLTDTTSIFDFTDEARTTGITGVANWAHRFSPFWTLRLRYQFDRSTNDVTPFFASRTNVSGLAGIPGNDQSPANWGPPTLTFASGVVGLTDALPASTTSQTHTWAAETLWSHGRHALTFGGGVHRQLVDLLSQQDPRGTFSFTGAATGSDIADFLLGLPHTSSIASGNPDKYLRATNGEAYVTDDWRVSPILTINAGVRWEYEGPMSERFGRLVNLAVTPGFSSAIPVVGSRPLASDWRGIEPRLGVAWRPIAGSSLVVRAGYGIYRNTFVYQPIETLLAQQPPLSNTFSVETTPNAPLTLANGFTPPAAATAANTFAVDPNLRVGFAQNWQLSVQRDLPASMTMVATYSGSKGSQLLQEFLPNTYAPGAVNPCASCPAGFVYLTSGGRSLRNAAQIELRRRLRNGLTATVNYTLAKAMDDAGAFTAVNLSGTAIAQNWQDLDAEWARSNTDQRHLLTAQVQYTTGVGVTGGGLLTGRRGAIVKNWTMSSQLTVGSGLPVTPVYLTSVPGTGVTGSIRASLTGAPTAPADGLYANPAGYGVPAPGQWGNAGRNSIVGPGQFGLNAGIARTFPVGERLNLDWRIDATNLINHVTYTGIGTLVGSPQFAAANRAAAMRKIQTTMRLRF